MDTHRHIAQYLIAHRGWQNRFPENTYLAIENAITAGAKHIEIDIQLSSDLIPYLSHDNTLQRLSNSPHPITQLSAKQIQALSSFEPTRFGQQFVNNPFCTLSQCVQLISAHPEVTLYAEIKNHSIDLFGVHTCLTAILPLLKPIEQQCVIISFDLNILIEAKRIGWRRLGLVLLNWQQAFETAVINLDPEIVFCDSDLLVNGNGPADLPFPTAIYEVGSYTNACLLLDQGAKLIETFCVGELIAEDNESSTK